MGAKAVRIKAIGESLVPKNDNGNDATYYQEDYQGIHHRWRLLAFKDVCLS